MWKWVFLGLFGVMGGLLATPAHAASPEPTAVKSVEESQFEDGCWYGPYTYAQACRVQAHFLACNYCASIYVRHGCYYVYVS
jgi:hypothetical protein